MVEPGRARPLLLVGAPPPRIAEIAEQAGARGLEDRVLGLGHREDVPAILAASDVVVDASYAGLGITGSIREALACERPVVATNIEGMPELVLDGETGLLVAPRSPAALADAIVRAREPTAAQTMARAGRKRVEALFSLRAKVDATEALYRQIVAAAGGHETRPAHLPPPAAAHAAVLLRAGAGLAAGARRGRDGGRIAWLVKPALDDIFIRRDEHMLKIIPLLLLGAYLLKGLAATASPT